MLLVDDLVDSGVTLARVQEHLTERYPAITVVRSAVLWYKACSKVTPDYHVQFSGNEPVDSSAVRRMGYRPSAQSGRVDQARHAKRPRLKHGSVAKNETRLRCEEQTPLRPVQTGRSGVLFGEGMCNVPGNAGGTRCYTHTRNFRRSAAKCRFEFGTG